MDSKTEQLKADIAKTKAELKEKASEFENRLRTNVTHAKDTVEGAIYNVQSVASGLSLKTYAQKRPMALLGGSVVSGIVVGAMLAPRPRLKNTTPPIAKRSLAGRIYEQFPDEVRILKIMAFNSLVNLVANKAKAVFPELAHQISEFEHKATKG